MKLSVDRERCCGAGMCALTAPALFDQDDEDGRVLLLDSAPGLHQQEAARNAAHACPCAVITILE